MILIQQSHCLSKINKFLPSVPGVSLFEASDGDMEGEDRGGAKVLNPDDYTVLAAGHEGVVCPQCGEEFESFYDEEKEEWRLRDALFDPEPAKLFHPICHQVSLRSPTSFHHFLLVWYWFF